MEDIREETFDQSLLASFRGQMKIGVLLLSVFIAASAGAQQRCVDLFLQQQSIHPSLAQTIEVLHSLETDRFVIYKEHSSFSLTEYLHWLEKKQISQIEALSQIPYPQLNPSVIQNYRELLWRALEHNKETHKELSEKYNLNQIFLSELVNPSTEYIDLSLRVLRMAIRTNPTLAEFLAIVRFPDVIYTETTIHDIVNQTTQKTPAIQRLLDEVGQKMMDFVSRENNSIIWGEVKYLGRHKLYDGIAGHDVIEKMKNAKRLARLMPTPTRVVLVLTGPGRLKPEAKAIYDNNGIEVIYLTPDWN